MNDTETADETVFRQYEQVRRSGATNMVMKTKVRDVAEELGLEELIEFIEAGHYYEIVTNYGKYKEKYNVRQ